MTRTKRFRSPKALAGEVKMWRRQDFRERQEQQPLAVTQREAMRQELEALEKSDFYTCEAKNEGVKIGYYSNPPFGDVRFVPFQGDALCLYDNVHAFHVDVQRLLGAFLLPTLVDLVGHYVLLNVYEPLVARDFIDKYLRALRLKHVHDTKRMLYELGVAQPMFAALCPTRRGTKRRSLGCAPTSTCAPNTLFYQDESGQYEEHLTLKLNTPLVVQLDESKRACMIRSAAQEELLSNKSVSIRLTVQADPTPVVFVLRHSL